MSTLFQKLLFDKELVKNDYGVNEPVPLPKHVSYSYVGGGEDAGEGEGSGDKPPPNIGATNIKYGQRMSLYFLLVFASLLISLIIFKNKAFKKAIFKRNPVKDIGEDIGNDTKKKTKMWTYVLLFISIFVAIFIGLWLVGSFIYIFIGVLGEDEPYKVAKQVWKYIFINFDEIPIGLNFWLVFFLVIIVLSFHYLGYAAFFNGWYEDMFFQDTGKKKEDSQLDSFIHYYAITILVIFTFFMILLCMKAMSQPGQTQLYAYYTMFMFLIYLAFSLYLMKQYKWGKYKKLAMILLLIFIVVFMYLFVITLLVSVVVASGGKGPSPLKAIFKKGSGTYSNLFLRWGIDASSVIPSKKAAAAKGSAIDSASISC